MGSLSTEEGGGGLNKWDTQCHQERGTGTMPEQGNNFVSALAKPFLNTVPCSSKAAVFEGTCPNVQVLQMVEECYLWCLADASALQELILTSLATSP